jgi:hypothetical protein
MGIILRHGDDTTCGFYLILDISARTLPSKVLGEISSPSLRDGDDISCISSSTLSTLDGMGSLFWKWYK